jgi:cytochrome P450
LNTELFAVLGDADAIHAVFNGSMEDFEKGELYDLIEAVFGESIFTADGPAWTALHEAVAPLFSSSWAKAMAPVVDSVIQRQIERWTGRMETGDPIDLMTDTKRLAFDVVARGLIGIRDEAAADRLFAILHRGDRVEGIRLKYLAKRAPDLQTHFRPSSLSDEINRAAYEIAGQRIATSVTAQEKDEDLIGNAISSRYFQTLGDQQRLRFVRDLVASMLSAGYVTTGESLFWSLYLLARHTPAQERARREVDAQEPSPWLAAVISETLRLYPPAWFLGRIARRPVEIGGETFTAGTRLICSPYVLHRMTALWPDPDEFRPERFLAPAAIEPRSYIPFGSGMRGCLGRALAMAEISAALPAVLSRFKLHLDDSRHPTLAGTFSMQPRESVRLRMTPR